MANLFRNKNGGYAYHTYGQNYYVRDTKRAYNITYVINNKNYITNCKCNRLRMFIRDIAYRFSIVFNGFNERYPLLSRYKTNE